MVICRFTFVAVPDKWALEHNLALNKIEVVSLYHSIAHSGPCI